MGELDLSGVDPLRWPEIRRRVAVLQSFAALDRPRAADRQAHAAQLGVGVAQFMRLFTL